MPETTLSLVITCLSFFLAALVYASVGHGGASAYLALMALLGVGMSTARPSALIMNSVVSLLSFIMYRSHAEVRWRLFLWLTMGSIPAAYAGAHMVLSDALYHRALGVFLLVAAARLLWRQNSEPSIKQAQAVPALIVGALIGFASGMLGIGGGVLLSPILIFLAWTSVREAALISSLFIFVNSLSGLAALSSTASQWSATLPWTWMSSAFVGGIAGSILGARRYSNRTLSVVLALVLILASVKLLSP